MDKNHLPKHIAIIMDGNGRWAEKRGLPRIAGHRAGAKTVRAVVEACARLGVKALTLYTFSSENWKRPKREIDALMKMLNEHMRKELPNLKKNNIRFNVIGHVEDLPKDVQGNIKNAQRQTATNSGLTLTLALNYGSRTELVDAARKAAKEIIEKKIEPKDLTEEIFAKHLYTKDLPEVDLMIRTSGELRLSNFLLWQLSYSEIFVTNKLWPDFNKEDLMAAIEAFKRRSRRYGGI